VQLFLFAFKTEPKQTCLHLLCCSVY